MTKNKSSDAEKTITPGADTLLTHGANTPSDFYGFVNPPVVHASTVLFPNVKSMGDGSQKYTYGRRGTPTSDALESAISKLEGAAGTKLATSGLNAIALALLSCLKAGDHVLIADTCYGPTREFADNLLPRYGISVSYFDPMVGAEIADQFLDTTKAVFLESPGSLTMELIDLDPVIAAAKAKGAKVLMDNTWATPLHYQPLKHGVDYSIHAATKYIVGHSDVMIGTVAANAKSYPDLEKTHGWLGLHVAPDDIYLALRGLRTLSVRLERHERNALAVAQWLQERPQVDDVLYPALPGSKSHNLWKSCFTGASGLFTFAFGPDVTNAQRTLFLDRLELFGLGFSWGGFESLAIPVNLKDIRTASNNHPQGRLMVRLHVGLEDPQDLIADLQNGFAAAFEG
ncbi:cystathionine beta-lyase [Roseibium limicola]|uniref:Cystathionine beta-lyase n=1 Tax=Roseibium limicola TaxID=2816037 RepID=A0A939ELF7_9HYPH|nr:cystathionine beta-lyase [Roseibium limicola]MBO0344623.1 cystathionine beta-lyase [Roseibium limicola]